MSKSGGTLIGGTEELGCIGGVPLGCFCSSNCQISGVVLTLIMLKSGMLLNIGQRLQEILHTQVVGEVTCQCFWLKRPVWSDIALDATIHRISKFRIMTKFIMYTVGNTCTVVVDLQ